MKIIYLISQILFIISLNLIKKTDEKRNLMLSTMISIVILSVINSAIALITTILNAPANLLVISIIYIILSIINYIIINKKEVQKYYFEKNSIFFMIFAIILVMIFAIVQYGKFDKIVYGSTDASKHYYSSYRFYVDSKLTIFDDSEKGNLFQCNEEFIGVYTNCGILMKLAKGIIPDLQMYKIYIINDLFMLFIFLILIYELCKEYLKKNKCKLIFSAISSILFAGGYFFNTIIMGWQYLTYGIIVNLVAIYILKQKGRINNNVWIIYFTILNFGVIHSYLIFTPIVFLTEFLYLIKKCEKRELFKILIISFLIPVATSIIYFIQNIDYKVTAIRNEGPMYKNIISNFVLMIPIIIYNLYLDIKSKKIFSVENIFLFVNILTILICYLMNILNFISPYYCFKYYYILQIAILLSFAQGLGKILEIKYKIGVIYISLLLLLVFVAFYIFNDYSSENLNRNSYEKNIFDFADMYNANYVLLKKKPLLNKNELEFVYNIIDIYEQHNSEAAVAGESQLLWICAIADDEKIYNKINANLVFEDVVKYDKIYMFKRTEFLKEYKNRLKEENYVATYSDDYCIILEKSD